MQAIDHTRTTFVDPQARELIMTILDAATALKRLLPDEELEHGFEFHWGHSNSLPGGQTPVFLRTSASTSFSAGRICRINKAGLPRIFHSLIFLSFSNSLSVSSSSDTLICPKSLLIIYYYPPASSAKIIKHWKNLSSTLSTAWSSVLSRL